MLKRRTLMVAAAAATLLFSAASQAQLISEAFVAADAPKTAYYQDNLARLARDLHRLDQDFKESLAWLDNIFEPESVR